MAISDDNIQLNSDYTYETYAQPPPSPEITQTFGDSFTVVNTINGRGGSNLTFNGGTTGLDFGGTGATYSLIGTLVVANGGTGATTAAGARTSLGAAASGANADINTFSALTGNGGFAAWTGTADGTSHATYSGTASVGYVQAELQGVMDKLKETTETLKKVLDALLASGVLEN